MGTRTVVRGYDIYYVQLREDYLYECKVTKANGQEVVALRHLFKQGTQFQVNKTKARTIANRNSLTWIDASFYNGYDTSRATIPSTVLDSFHIHRTETEVLTTDDTVTKL